MLTYVLPSVPPFAIIYALLFEHVRHNLAPGEKHYFVSTKVMSSAALTVPLLFVFAVTIVLPKLTPALSQKQLVDTFRQLSPGGGEELVFVGGKPYSGLFYSQGLAELVSASDPSLVRNELAEDEDIYFAVANKSRKTMPQEMNLLTAEVKDFPKFHLRRKLYP